MDLSGAAGERRTADAEPVFLYPGKDRFLHLRVGRESEVIVGDEIYTLFARDHDAVPAGGGDFKAVCVDIGFSQGPQ